MMISRYSRVGAGMGLAILGVMLGCGESSSRHQATQDPAVSDGAAARPVIVEVEPVRVATNLTSELLPGTVRAELKATIASKGSGRVGRLAVSEGQRVVAGDLLLELEAEEIRARNEQAQARRAQARQEWERVMGLQERQAVTPQELDRTRAEMQVAEAAFQEAQAQLEEAVIRAPFDGVITRRWIQAGELATPGKPLLELSDPGTWQLEVDVPETLVGQAETGSLLEVRLAAGPGTVAAPIRELAPATEPRARTVRVKLALEEDRSLRDGMFGEVVWPLDAKPTLVAPIGALVVRGSLEMVFVVEDGRARMRLVKAGRRWRGEVELLSGVQAGDLVVAAGAEGFWDGHAVTVKP